MSTAGEKFQRLVEIMARLRGPNGCPWDSEQTFDTIKPYTLEETYEVLDAIDRRDWGELSEELGDFLLQAVFYAQMAEEQSLFRISDVLDAIIQKLIRRHPHVFGDESAPSASDVKRIWGEVKAAEQREKGTRNHGLLASVPRALPALVEAQQIASRAAHVGFDWETPEQVIEKLHEELGELDRARRARVLRSTGGLSFREYTRCCGRGGRAKRGIAQGADGVAPGWPSEKSTGLAANRGAQFDH